MDNNKNFFNQLNPSKIYGNEIYEKTKKYQKQYGFKIGKGKQDTWNNESDAFKHTFMQADLALKTTAGISKFLGDWHESKGRKTGQNPKEENMDKWNNAIGREIAQEIENEIDSITIKYLILNNKMDDIVAQKVVNRMKKGDLITDPFNDKRLFENSYYNGHIYTIEEIEKMTSQEFKLHKQEIMKQIKDKGMPMKDKSNANGSKSNDTSNNSGSDDGHWVTINGNHVLIDN
ncbi:MAG: hypothetical protein PHX18_08415 [Candidatus Gastranaerophilales bacterium]|nr:hypothetical protein [Candidatus Gastranaerophilales bacterium]